MKYFYYLFAILFILIVFSGSDCNPSPTPTNSTNSPYSSKGTDGKKYQLKTMTDSATQATITFKYTTDGNINQVLYSFTSGLTTKIYKTDITYNTDSTSIVNTYTSSEGGTTVSTYTNRGRYEFATNKITSATLKFYNQPNSSKTTSGTVVFRPTYSTDGTMTGNTNTFTLKDLINGVASDNNSTGTTDYTYNTDNSGNLNKEVMTQSSTNPMNNVVTTTKTTKQYVTYSTIDNSLNLNISDVYAYSIIGDLIAIGAGVPSIFSGTNLITNSNIGIVYVLGKNFYTKIPSTMTITRETTSTSNSETLSSIYNVFIDITQDNTNGLVKELRTRAYQSTKANRYKWTYTWAVL